MKLIKTSAVAAVAVTAVSGTALAADFKTNSVTTHMRGTSHVATGGKLTLTVAERLKTSTQFRVKIHYDVNITSPTVLHFAAYPCRYATCIGSSVSATGKLSARVHHITFSGKVPINRRSDGTACVFAQIRDYGPKGKAPGVVVKHTKHSRGVRLCFKP